jgi:hypothetical protein
MTHWLFSKRWYLLLVSILFGSLFIAWRVFFSSTETDSMTSNEMYVFFISWWGATIFFYVFWLVNVLHGKDRQKSIVVKTLKMLPPSLFVLLGFYVTSLVVSSI